MLNFNLFRKVIIAKYNQIKISLKRKIEIKLKTIEDQVKDLNLYQEEEKDATKVASVKDNFATFYILRKTDIFGISALREILAIINNAEYVCRMKF